VRISLAATLLAAATTETWTSHEIGNVRDGNVGRPHQQQYDGRQTAITTRVWIKVGAIDAAAIGPFPK